MKLSLFWQMFITVTAIGGGVTVYNDFQTEKSNFKTKKELIHYADSLSQVNSAKNLIILSDIISKRMTSAGIVDYDLIFSASEQTAKKYYSKNQRSNKALFKMIIEEERMRYDTVWFENIWGEKFAQIGEFVLGEWYLIKEYKVDKFPFEDED